MDLVTATRRRLIAAGPIAAGLMAAGLTATAGAARAQPVRTPTMGLASTSFATAPARLATELGLYEPHGLLPRFIVLDSASAVTTALISRSVDFALSGPAELVMAQARDQKVVSIANIYVGFSGTIVLAKSVAERSGVRPDAPLADRLKALDGLLLASPSATGAYTIAPRAAAKAAGATPRFTYMGLASMNAALESGAIQGYVAGAPFWSTPVTRGTGVVWLSGPRGDLPAAAGPASSANLQVMRDYAEAHPDVVRDMVAVFTDLARAIGERPEAVKAALSRLYPDLGAPTLDLLFVAESPGWKAAVPTVADMTRDIAFTRSAGVNLPRIDTLDPRSMLFP